jgi:hypothetical protein
VPFGYADVLTSKKVFVDGHPHVAVLEIEKLSQRESISELRRKAEALFDLRIVIGAKKPEAASPYLMARNSPNASVRDPRSKLQG